MFTSSSHFPPIRSLFSSGEWSPLHIPPWQPQPRHPFPSQDRMLRPISRICPRTPTTIYRPSLGHSGKMWLSTRCVCSARQSRTDGNYRNPTVITYRTFSYLYTYTMDLAQDHPQGLRTDRSIDMIDQSTVSSKQTTGRTRDASSCTDTASSDYSIQSYHVRRPEPALSYSVRRPEPAAPVQPQTTVSVHKPAATDSIADVTLHSGAEDNSAEARIRQEITVTFYLFGQSDRGDYFRLRLFDAFLGKTSLRRVLRSFGAATDCDFKEFLDHLYMIPGNGDLLKDATKWKKLSRDSVSMTIRDLRFNGSPFTDEFVLIVDLIGVHGMSPAVRRSIGKK
ncbi:hypothetical protein PRIPAC_83316 [Pristionchus pacificus]|uniref:Uncharacterized protein n=1 Tax=Pristionchus pacificus TaxID=54126 RepID=A0A2A6BLH5_PRIPA|nr:hypothetical protein PRIPAC_83316 [Pristionchus pacificus]|eukprot:PDM66747.1 hypothetical protein PRIPAC_48164 [Pristionchus pacificus]